MITLVLAIAAAYGTFLAYTSVALGWEGLRVGPAPGASRRRARLADWRQRVGLEEVDLRHAAAALLTIATVGVLAASVVFGPGPAALAIGLLAAALPLGSLRARRRRRLAVAQAAWPWLIEEMRVLTGSSGRSIPQALFEVGARAPQELRPAFDAAHREWLLSTDLDRSLHVLRERLADATADAVCETLLVAHRLGGGELDVRLRALAEDRHLDLQGRKDAVSRQAGARFARRFVLLVPAGMALAGLGIGDGRAAYATPFGQAAVLAAIAMVALCWVWAGRVMALPPEPRVFGR